MEEIVNYLSHLDLDWENAPFLADLYAVENPLIVERLCGFIHVLRAGHAWLIGNNLLPYRVEAQMVRDYRLGMGDFIEARVSFCQTNKCPAVQEIAREEQKRYADIKGVRPSRKNNTVTLGTKVLIVADKTFDRIENIKTMCGELKEITKVALLIEESKESVEYLTGVCSEVFLTEAGFDMKKQVLLALYALFSAQKRAANGENVVFFVDNLSKLFRVYNRNVSEGMEVSAAALGDLKTFYSSNKALEGGGSLTIVGYINKPISAQEQMLYDEFSDLANEIYNHSQHPATQR